MPRQEPKDRVKIDAPLDNIIELVKGAFEPVQTTEQEMPRTLPESYGEEQPTGRDWRHLPESNPQSTMNRLGEVLSALPLRGDYKPSKMRRFGAAVVGGLTGAAGGPETGMKVASSILEAPYREQYQDWLTKSGALEKQANLEIEREKAETGGLSGYAAYINALRQSDPELLADIEGGRVRAREEALEPGREAGFTREQGGREAIEDIRRERERALETARQGGRRGLERFRQTGRETISNKDRLTREKVARDQMLSRENIARLNRELRNQLQSSATRNQRVPPSQQYLGRLMAENEISQLISDPEEFDALFTSSTDSNGRPIVILKPDRDVPAAWKAARPDGKGYDARKKQINDLLKELIKTSYSPSSEDGSEDGEEDQYEFKELE